MSSHFINELHHHSSTHHITRQLEPELLE